MLLEGSSMGGTRGFSFYFFLDYGILNIWCFSYFTANFIKSYGFGSNLEVSGGPSLGVILLCNYGSSTEKVSLLTTDSPSLNYSRLFVLTIILFYTSLGRSNKFLSGANLFDFGGNYSSSAFFFGLRNFFTVGFATSLSSLIFVRSLCIFLACMIALCTLTVSLSCDILYYSIFTCCYPSKIISRTPRRVLSSKFPLTSFLASFLAKLSISSVYSTLGFTGSILFFSPRLPPTSDFALFIISIASLRVNAIFMRSSRLFDIL